MKRTVPLRSVAAAIPLARPTLYIYRARGTLPWLQRVPHGQLAVDWPAACSWFAARGTDLPELAKRALSASTCDQLGLNAPHK